MKYPELTYYKQFNNPEMENMYREITVWASHLISQLERQDTENIFSGATRVLTATSTSDYRGALGGSIMYATSRGKYYGWNALTSAWDPLS